MKIQPTRYYTRYNDTEYLVIAHEKQIWDVFTQITTERGIKYWRRIRRGTPRWLRVIEAMNVAPHDKSRKEQVYHKMTGKIPLRGKQHA